MLIEIEENQRQMTLTYPRTRHYVAVGVSLLLIAGFFVLLATDPKRHLPNMPGISAIIWLRACVPLLLLLVFMARSLWQLRPDNNFTLDRMRGELRQGTRVAAFLNDIVGVEIHSQRNGRRDTLIEANTYLLRLKLNNGRHIPLASSANSLSLGGGEQEIRDLAPRIAAYLNVTVLDASLPERNGLFF